MRFAWQIVNFGGKRAPQFESSEIYRLSRKLYSLFNQILNVSDLLTKSLSFLHSRTRNNSANFCSRTRLHFALFCPRQLLKKFILFSGKKKAPNRRTTSKVRDNQPRWKSEISKNP